MAQKMPDQHHDDALEHIDALLRVIEGAEIPASEDFPGISEALQDTLSAVAEKAITLRDRMTGEDGSYTVGG